MWIAIGATWFVWIGIEDRDLLLVSLEAGLISVGLGVTAVVRLLSGADPGAVRNIVGSLAIGSLVGASSSLISALLMGVKASLHQHPVADFTASDAALVLGSVPVRMGLGALVGLGLGALLVAVRIDSQSDD